MPRTSHATAASRNGTPRAKPATRRKHHAARVIGVLFLLGIAVNNGIAAGAVDSGGSLRARLSAALATGDAATVARLESTRDFPLAYTKMFSYQLHYDLPQLAKWAATCRTESVANHSTRAPLYCNAVQFSAAYADGDAPAAFEALAWRRSEEERMKSRPYHLAMYGTSLDATSAADLKKLAGSLPPPQISAPPGPFTLPNVNPQPPGTHWVAALNRAPVLSAGANAQPTVRVTINGHPTTAMLDTGTSLSVVIDGTSLAKRLGLEPVTGNAGRVHAPIVALLGRKPTADATLAMLGTLWLGPMSAHHLLVTVLPDGYASSAFPAQVVIGLPILARFANVTFRNHDVGFNGPAGRCTHPAALTFATDTNQKGLLVFRATLNGRPSLGTLDTGSASVATLLVPQSACGKAARLMRAPTCAPAPSARYGRLDAAFGPSNYFRLVAASSPIMDGSIPYGERGFSIGSPLIATRPVGIDFRSLRLCIGEPSDHGTIASGPPGRRNLQ